MRFLTRSIIGLFLLGLTLGLLTFAGYSVYTAVQERLAREPVTRPARERVFAASVVRVVPGDIAPTISLFGEVRSSRILELRAPAGGAVVELSSSFEEGGVVAAGEVLLRVDPAAAQSGVDTARVDVAQGEADVRDAERGLELARDEVAAARAQVDLRAQAVARQKNLAERGVGSAAAVETAELALSAAEQAVLARRQAEAQAEARLDQARTTLQRRHLALADAERRLADTVMRADFAGTLSNVTVLRGGLVSVNERVARLIDTEALEVAFRVSNTQYARLLDARGRLLPAEVTLVLDVYGVGLTARGVIVRESGIVGEGTTGRQVFARISDGAGAGLRPGDFVSVEIAEPVLSGVARIPASALSAAGTVLVLDSEDRLREVAVEVLRKQENDAVIRAPALHGQRIIAERTPLLGMGVRVRPVERDPSGAVAIPEPEYLELTDERRSRLIAFVEGNSFIPTEVRQRLVAQLNEPRVPAEVVNRIEARMGG